MRFRVVAAALALLLVAGVPRANALHVVSDDIPEGALNVPAGGEAALILDVSPRDFIQWTWSVRDGNAETLSTQVVWTDKAGVEARQPRLAAGVSSGNFDAPAELAGARIVFTNSGAVAAKVAWSYAASAAFWKRPEFFLPAMLPLFLVAGAFWLGRRIDRRTRTIASQPRAVPARATGTPQQETP